MHIVKPARGKVVLQYFFNELTFRPKEKIIIVIKAVRQKKNIKRWKVDS